MIRLSLCWLAACCASFGLFVSAPAVAQTTFNITVGSNPTAGSFLMIIVDGDVRQGNPESFTWDEGSLHRVTAISPQSCGVGCQFVFTSWSDGGAQSHDVTVTAQLAPLILANFEQQFTLTMHVTPAGAGTVLPGTVWRKASSSLTITAAANAGYAFRSWTGIGSGNYTGLSNAHSVKMNEPTTETATFVHLTAITIASNPAGTGYVKVNGVDAPTPQAYNWAPGSTQTITAISPVSCGVGCQYVFTTWSDGNTQPSRTITTPSSPTTYTATFQKQYLLTMKTNPQASGSVAPGNGWHNSGTTVALATSPGTFVNVIYAFGSWAGTGSGSYTGTTNHASVTMNEPITEIANFSKVKIKIPPPPTP